MKFWIIISSENQLFCLICLRLIKKFIDRVPFVEYEFHQWELYN